MDFRSISFAIINSLPQRMAAFRRHGQRWLGLSAQFGAFR